MIIGISGKMGSGKDTVADILVEKYHFKKLPFAWVLKHIARDLLGWSGKKDDEGRNLLQQLGTEIARAACGEDVWCQFTERIIKILKEESKEKDIYFVIPDVRFVSEAEWINKRGGFVIYVDRPCNPIAPTGNPSHRSEKEMGTDTFKQQVWKIIENDGSKEDLKKKVRDLYDNLITEVYFSDNLTSEDEGDIVINY